MMLKICTANFLHLALSLPQSQIDSENDKSLFGGSSNYLTMI